eukprot:6795463-Prorocentrum_lima.AAC.1
MACHATSLHSHRGPVRVPPCRHPTGLDPPHRSATPPSGGMRWPPRRGETTATDARRGPSIQQSG